MIKIETGPPTCRHLRTRYHQQSPIEATPWDGTGARVVLWMEVMEVSSMPVVIGRISSRS